MVGAGATGWYTQPGGASTVIGRYEPSLVPRDVSARNMIASRAAATVVSQWQLPDDDARCGAQPSRSMVTSPPLTITFTVSGIGSSLRPSASWKPEAWCTPSGTRSTAARTIRSP